MKKATKKEIEEIERELADQSHRIVFGTVPKRKLRTAVNPKRTYADS